jgi:CHAD domain-containing protein
MKAHIGHDPLSESVRQLILREMDNMCYPPRADHAVHDVRLSGKRIRAWLRLLRDAMGTGAYRRENAAIRDLGRLLRHRRDSEVLIETLDGLAKSGAKAFGATEVDRLKGLLRTDAETADAEMPFPDVMMRVREVLFQAHRRVETLDLGHGHPELTFRRIWTRARDAYNAARDKPDTNTLHEWRKQAKYLRYQLEALKDIWPRRVKRWTKRLKAQADELGHDHDLAVLAERLTAGPQHAEISRLRQGLQTKLLRKSRGFYRPKPAAQARRLTRRWKQWRTAV